MKKYICLWIIVAMVFAFITAVDSSYAVPNNLDAENGQVIAFKNTDDIQSIQGYSDKGILIEFRKEVAEKMVNVIRIKDVKGNIYTSEPSKKINGTNYTYEFKTPLGLGSQYFVLGKTEYGFKFNYRHQSQLHVIAEHTRVLNTYQFKLVFNNNLDPSLALNTDHFRVKEGLWIKSVKFDVKDNGELDLQTLILDTEAQKNGSKYTVIIDPKVADSEKVSLDLKSQTVTLYGAAEDNAEPKVERVLINSNNRIQIEFNETSGLETLSVLNKANYRVFDIETNRAYEIKSVQLKKNKTTDVYANVLLTTENLGPGKRYMVEVLHIKDILGNTISEKNYYRGSFTYDDTLVNSLRLLSVECLTSEVLRISFNRPVHVASEFNFEDIKFSSGSKALEVYMDPIALNAVVVKTDGNGKSGFYTVRIANIEDNFGNVTTQGTAVGTYSVNISDEQRPMVSFLEVDTYNRSPGITVNFTKPMDKNSVEDLSKYSIQGLSILYVYKVSDYKVRVITSAQKNGVMYNLEIREVLDAYGQSLMSNYYSGPFMGKNLNE